ncbi:hypothetical protein [Brachyspira pilosicoli]|uniref:hypothetical protein n=1 Tax=Brachyspira pilosicoli TaxID=52584 RepID=UPI000C76D5A4|nr:hypothetical protein [Brachyspira pilosicoli]PLV58877.1 hypothetical protein BPSP16_07490 [Brachyspira pilosicoli SP16]
MNKKILSIFVMIMALSLFGVSCSNEDSTGPGGNNSGTTDGSGTHTPTPAPKSTPTPLTKEEVVKFQGRWEGELRKKSGYDDMTQTYKSIFTINADGSIKDETTTTNATTTTTKIITLDKINKVSDNVFEFTCEVKQGAKFTLKHKVDFTDNNAPKDTLVCTRERQGQSASATYEGTLTKIQ